MHIGKSYGLVEFLRWTRRKAYVLAAGSIAVSALYQLAGWHWLALPWPVLAMLGTAASFIVGFKNAQTYSRTTEAQQIWSGITASSRYWGLIARDFPASGPAEALLTRHLCWLTAVRYQLRVPRVWEAATHAPNAEYRQKAFGVPELEVPFALALGRYLPPEAIAALIATGNVPATLIGEQSRDIRALFVSQDIALIQYAEMQKTLKDLLEQYSRAERIKNFPRASTPSSIRCSCGRLPCCCRLAWSASLPSSTSAAYCMGAWHGLACRSACSSPGCTSRSTRSEKAPKTPSRAGRTMCRSPIFACA